MMSFLSVRWFGALALLSALFVAVMFVGLALTPDAVRARNEAGQFDAAASRERLVRILGDETPHPVDSAAEDVVRERLLQEIVALGFKPEVRDTFACRPQPRGPLVDCARVRNIVFSVGPGNGPAILAAAHYDSVTAAPGASDDGIGVSVWLQIASMISREQLTRRVIFLFSDGEEPGLLGAYAFGADDPLIASVESLVNLEARGSRGPAIFFESNQPNADSIAAFSDAPRPIANSVMADVYALLSNSSDVTALTRPGLDVLNIAVLDGLEDYHTPQDNIASQDLRSVQHMGDVALSVVRRLAGERDADVVTPMVYTDVASRAFIAAPSWVGQAALAVCALIAGFAFWRAGTVGRWSALAAPVLAIVVAGIVAFGFGFLLSALRPGADYGFAHPEPARAWCIFSALFGAVVSLCMLRGERSPAQTLAGAMMWFAALGGGLSFFLPGISILFAIPAALFALGALIALAWRPAGVVGAWLAAFAALVIWAPLLSLIELALGFEMPFALALIGAMMILPWLGLIGQVRGEGRWRELVSVCALGLVASFALSAITPSMSEARPRSLNITYFVNTSDNEARVLAGSAERELPQTLAGGFRPELILPGDRFNTWAAAAPVEPIAAPALEDIVVSQENGERVVRARLAMNGAYRAILRIPMAAEPLRANVNGVLTDFADTGGDSAEFMNLACQGRACDGATIEVALGASAQGEWYMIGQFPGRISAASEVLRARRGSTATPIQGGDGTTTLTRFVPN
ncbi:MAG: M28 family peptidase [Alphaproteobacteria bacterium]|nr:M28 family peptidase [Alphaproteobacteria bacterium]